MKTRVSALMDGELDVEETTRVIRAMRNCGEMRADWMRYHHIGACLRGEPEMAVDVVVKVMAVLEHEPTVLAPSPRQPVALMTNTRLMALRPLMAMAASAAGVALVAWMALSPEMQTPAAPGVVAKAAASVAQAVPKANEKETSRMQSYLVAHQAHAPGSAIVGGVRNIRTVSAAGSAR
jgi:sigma-E factor negative regulatory protein RseA